MIQAKAYIELNLQEVKLKGKLKEEELDKIVLLPTRSPEQEKNLAFNIVTSQQQLEDYKTILHYIEDIIQNSKLLGIYLE